MDVGAEMSESPRVRFTRHNLGAAAGRPTDLFFAPLDGSDALLRYKGMLYRSGVLKNSAQKVVGAVGSRSRIGQAAQAAGSIALPGNVSPARSPIRSGIARALTPGGGSGRGGVGGKPERGYRCPEGFQFGGRFTDANFSTCGKQLFDIPSLRETIAQAVYRTRGLRSVGSAPQARAQTETLRAQEAPQTDLMIRRAANVPRVGDADANARSSSIQAASEAVQNQDAASAILVRRDGYTMVPVVTAEELRGVPDNRNMEGAAWVQSVRDADAIGRDELGFLSNTGVTTLVYVTPNGVKLTLDRQRDLSTGERRQLGKDVNTAADMDVDSDPAARLRFIAEESNGAFEYSEDFGDVENPEEASSSEDGEGKANWIVGAFVDQPEERTEEAAEPDAAESGAPADGEQPASVAPATAERIDSLKEAVEHLNKGGLLADIEPSLIVEALKRSEAYEQTELRDDISVFENDEGRRILLKENPDDFEHISAHLTSDVLRELGVQAPTVRFTGEGKSRPFIWRSPDSVVEGAEADPEMDPEDLAPEIILGTQISDWLTDTRDRTTASFVGVRAGDEEDAVVTVGPPAALIGLSKSEIEARRRVGPEDFFDQTTNSYGRNYADLDEEQRQLILQTVDALLERARAFSFADYREKLQIDGELSSGERQHLEIVEGIYNQRLEMLEEQRDAVLAVLGLP